EHTDVVQPEESTLEDVHALGVLAVYPPGEVQHEFVKDTLEKRAITLAFSLLVDFVDAPRSPSVYRRVHVAESPLVSGNLSVGVPVPFAQHQSALFFSAISTNKRKRDAVRS